MVEVTPDDREAYLAMNMLPEFDAADVRAGLWDKVTGLQAFAAHRIAHSQPDPLVGELVSALRAIAAEAERENGRWVHLKRCISVQCRKALAKWEARHDAA